MTRITKTIKTAMNPTKHDWASAMTQRLKDQLSDYDDVVGWQSKDDINGIIQKLEGMK